MEASSNVHAIGVIQDDDAATSSITTDAPFPHLRPYTYNYHEKTGMAGRAPNQPDNNGGYNGFWLIGKQDAGQQVTIKNISDKNTRIILENAPQTKFKSGDSFEIRLLAPGDVLEVPVWGQAIRNGNGSWTTSGPAKVTIQE